MNPHENPTGFFGILAAIGIVVGIGKMLAADEQVNHRVLFGRCIVNAATTAAAGSVLLIVPDAPPLLMLSIAAGIGSLGTSFLEYILARKLGVGPLPPEMVNPPKGDRTEPQGEPD